MQMVRTTPDKRVLVGSEPTPGTNSILCVDLFPNNVSLGIDNMEIKHGQAFQDCTEGQTKGLHRLQRLRPLRSQWFARVFIVQWHWCRAKGLNYEFYPLGYQRWTPRLSGTA